MQPSNNEGLPSRIVAALRRQAWVFKAMSFASIGVVNSLVDLGLFLLALRYLTASLVAANILSWCVAVSGSYVMNSFITFAAESGRSLRWRTYATFVAAQVLGLVASTGTLVAAALVMPVLPAKLLAIGAAFLVNFSMSHFVVFRKRATVPSGPDRESSTQ
ncbi:putative flippase GtrA [Pseudorhodoplanes sinuspersici]|uniref:Uncharacterized protein n=2 Tax=Pseudorhodoplanes sinuspersici TaxID=1235591 RepID=A0A1W6ZZZ1_9HYPH|nr:hypothetical protein CAK95_13195 [Pseudorhodoplanes sinuspersici]RKE70955.1 putative flippase GtrA [Pseudorhodoplanes sinuspersici]